MLCFAVHDADVGTAGSGTETSAGNGKRVAAASGAPVGGASGASITGRTLRHSSAVVRSVLVVYIVEHSSRYQLIVGAACDPPEMDRRVLSRRLTCACTETSRSSRDYTRVVDSWNTSQTTRRAKSVATNPGDINACSRLELV